MNFLYFLQLYAGPNVNIVCCTICSTHNLYEMTLIESKLIFSVSVELSEMASPPVISAPTLVTSTNQAATASHAHAGPTQAVMATPSSIPSEKDNDDWRFKYLEAKGNYRKLKSQKREQAKKSRQLIVAVKNKLQDEDNEKMKVISLHRII